MGSLRLYGCGIVGLSEWPSNTSVVDSGTPTISIQQEVVMIETPWNTRYTTSCQASVFREAPASTTDAALPKNGALLQAERWHEPLKSWDLGSGDDYADEYVYG